MIAVINTLLFIISIAWFLVIASAIFSWLYAFNVVNPRNQFIATVGQILYNLTEPALRPIRRFIPSLNGLDLSPIVLLLGIFLLQNVIIRHRATTKRRLHSWQERAAAGRLAKERVAGDRGTHDGRQAPRGEWHDPAFAAVLLNLVTHAPTRLHFPSGTHHAMFPAIAKLAPIAVNQAFPAWPAVRNRPTLPQLLTQNNP